MTAKIKITPNNVVLNLKPVHTYTVHFCFTKSEILKGLLQQAKHKHMKGNIQGIHKQG